MSNYKAYRGSINNLLLKALLSGDKYGYEIIKEIESATKGSIKLKQPSLYSSLRRMEEQGLISSYWQDSEIGGRRHYYRLTEKGKNYKKDDYDNSPSQNHDDTEIEISDGNDFIYDSAISLEEDNDISSSNNSDIVNNKKEELKLDQESTKEPSYVIAKQENLFSEEVKKIPQIEENDISYVQYDLFNEQQSIIKNNFRGSYEEPKLYTNRYEQYDNHTSSIQPQSKTIPTLSQSPTPIINSENENESLNNSNHSEPRNFIEQIEQAQHIEKYGENLPTIDFNFESLFGGWDKKSKDDNSNTSQEINDSNSNIQTKEQDAKYITEYDDVSASQAVVENNVYLRSSGEEITEKKEEPAFNRFTNNAKDADYIINKKITSRAKDYKDVLDNLYSLKNEEYISNTKEDFTENQIDLNKTLNSEGIKISYYSKFSEKNKYQGQFICYNKIKFINSLICYALALGIIWITYLILSQTTSVVVSQLHFYIIATLVFLIYPLIYTILYLSNPDKKLESHYNLRLGIINSTLAILGCILIILSINIFAGMNNLNQIDFISYWLLPSLLTLMFLFETIFYFILTKSRKFRN